MIAMARTVCGEDCEITIDTAHANYWNYKIDPKKFDQSWGNSIYTDFANFSECALKMCVEIFDEEKANILAERLEQCDCIRFSDGYWYKFTRKNVTKENAIMRIAEAYGFGMESIIAFGDDYRSVRIRYGSDHCFWRRFCRYRYAGALWIRCCNGECNR